MLLILWVYWAFYFMIPDCGWCENQQLLSYRGDCEHVSANKCTCALRLAYTCVRSGQSQKCQGRFFVPVQPYWHHLCSYMTPITTFLSARVDCNSQWLIYYAHLMQHLIQKISTRVAVILSPKFANLDCGGVIMPERHSRLIKTHKSHLHCAFCCTRIPQSDIALWD